MRELPRIQLRLLRKIEILFIIPEWVLRSSKLLPFDRSACQRIRDHFNDFTSPSAFVGSINIREYLCRAQFFFSTMYYSSLEFHQIIMINFQDVKMFVMRFAKKQFKTCTFYLKLFFEIRANINISQSYNP